MTFHVPSGVRGYFFVFCSFRTSGSMFLGARKLKKKEQIEESYISKVNTLKTEFICEHKKLFLRSIFRNSI